MQLTQIALQRFKAIREADIRPAPLTVLIGRNNSGKSSVLQALALLAQSAAANAGQVVTSGRVDLGADPHQLTSIDAEPNLGWTVQLSWLDALPPTDPVGPGQPVVIGFELNVPGTAPAWSRAWVGVQSPTPRKVNVSARSDSNNLAIRADDFRDQRSVIAGFEETRQIGTGNLWRYGMGVRLEMPQWTSQVVGDAQNVASREYPLEIAARYMSRDIAETLDAFQYVGPGRQFNRSQLGLIGQIPVTIGSVEEVASALAYQRELKRRVSARCREIFKYGIEIENVPSPQSIVVTAVDAEDRALNAVNMGSGFNQVAWMAVVLENRILAQQSGRRTTAIVGIEEPELHLHPAAQSDVASVLATYAKSGVQIIVTTHSEHLLQALLRLVLKGELTDAQIGVLYMEDGKAEALAVDDWGRLRGGLKGFFDTTEEELTEHLDLLIDKSRTTEPKGG